MKTNVKSMSLFIALTYLTACSSEGSRMTAEHNAKQGSEQDYHSTGDANPGPSAADANQAPSSGSSSSSTSGTSSDNSANEAAGMPSAVSGAYLTCPVIDASTDDVQVGCNFQDEKTNDRVDPSTLFQSVSWSVSATDNVAVSLMIQPFTAPYSGIVKVHIPAGADRDTVLSGIHIKYTGKDKANKDVTAQVSPQVQTGSNVSNTVNISIGTGLH